MAWVKLIVLSAVALGGALLLGEVGRFAGPVTSFLLEKGAAYGLPAWAPGLVWALVKIVLVLHVPLLSALVFVWWERKISAHMQSRLGPMYVGGFHGWLQTVADGIKLLLKENITPAAADTWVHRLAPAGVVAPAILAVAPVSFGKDLAAADLDVGLVY
ncbi:MAG: NADH-quinone oxidoreductase subunit H, partial [Elusimicrobia bacterium]|nr:NADH-quinone oxidoreductase subunit H [Elusimicrobiota bacterium]